jgi:hypothetical protein
MAMPGPADIVHFWFPDGEMPDLAEHMRLWNWCMRGGGSVIRADHGHFDALPNLLQKPPLKPRWSIANVL